LLIKGNILNREGVLLMEKDIQTTTSTSSIKDLVEDGLVVNEEVVEDDK
jgi:hypothetical protein